jgi:hypothetical protein
MIKPVAVFRSVVIGDPGHTIRLDETRRLYLVIFTSFSRYITSWAILYQPHGRGSHLQVDATGRDRVYGWLSVGYHVSGVSRPGRVGHSDPRPNGHLPALFGGPFHVQLGEWVFVRWIGPLE